MANKIPSFAYTGLYSTELKNGYWYIKFLTSGTLSLTYGKTLDVFLVGGGGGGITSGGGGGGGYTKTYKSISVPSGEYNIVVGLGGPAGSDGGSSEAFGYSAAGGKGAINYTGGDGGSGGGGRGGTGGAGGSDGGNGADGRETEYVGSGGKGQGTSTREFGESSGALYSGGGGGFGREVGGGGAGGAGGGGRGATYHYGHEWYSKAGSGIANTGGGGGGDAAGIIAGEGGSGIVIVRSTQDDQLPVKFDGVTLQRILFNGSEVQSLIYNGTKLFIEKAWRWLSCLKSMGARFRSAPATRASFVLRLKAQA